MSVQGITVTRDLETWMLRSSMGIALFKLFSLSYNIQILIKPYIFMKHMDVFPLLQKVIGKH